ncbi:MAG: cupin domain-containing protein [Actinomycetota bacterium]
MHTETSKQIIDLARGEGEARWWFEGLATVKLTGEQTGGQFSLTEMLYPAGAIVPRHVHHPNDELFYILEGELTMEVAGRPIEARAGTSIFIPRETPHGFQVGPSGPVRYLMHYSPAGFEGFILESGQPARDLTLPPPPEGSPSPEQIREIDAMMVECYGCEWVEDPTNPAPIGAGA